MLACVSTWKGADTWEGADTSRRQHVPTRADTCDANHMNFIWMLICVDMCQHLKNTDTCRHVPTHLGADTCRHLWYSSYGLCYLQTGMCWHVSAPKKVPTPGKVPTRADTSRHRHVQTRADTCDANHMNFIWILICVDMCQHLKKCRHLGRCRHVPARADTSRCRHVPTPVVLIIWTLLFANWDVLACVSTWKGADTWEGADTCRHV